MKNIAIIGGGIGGICAAIALKRKGIEVHVYEKAPVLKEVGAGISLSANAVMALRQIGLDQELIQVGHILKYMHVLDQKGRQITATNLEPVEKEFKTVNFSIHRAVLHDILRSHLPAENLHLGKAIKSCTQQAKGVHISFEDGSVAEADALLAFDGIHSTVRKQLLPQSELRYAGYTCWRAIIDYVPEGWQAHQATESWGKAGRFGMVPIGNDKLYWFATANAPAQDARMRAFGVKELQQHFKAYHAPVGDILAHTQDEQLLWNDIIDLKPINQYAFGRIVLAGDAAHATTPNMGQGACMAIEDAIVLANLLKKLEPEAAFFQYEKMRMSRARQIVYTSHQLGKVSQWEHPLLCTLRNTAFRLIPPSVQLQQIRKVYRVQLDV